MKPLIALVLAGATLGGGAYWYLSPGQGTSAPTIRVDVKEGNGKVTVSWTRVKTSGGAAVTGYHVMAEPYGTDRVPPPRLVTPQAQRVPATVSQLTISGLLADCHQLYQVVVTPATGAGSGPAAKSPVFRPSGIVETGKPPPYVVILLDGINESQPGFRMNPYKPTLDGNASYCPEARNASSGTEAEADFTGAPKGPWSFFHKWNFGEVKDGQAVGPNDRGYDESAPRAVAYPKPPPNVAPGTYTHNFMLDAIASRGAIILPFSYKGYGFAPNFQVHPGFSYYGYWGCQATPGCGPSIHDDAKLLDSEVNDAASVWPTSKIVVMGHSQGGLIAFEWWACSHGGLPQSAAKDCGGTRTTLPPNFVAGFSLDSPINGACGQALGHGPCIGPPTYPDYGERAARDAAYVSLDSRGGRSFYFIGTYGDSPIGGYQSGAKTLAHQLLFTEPESAIDSACGNPLKESACPAAPLDHISDCPVDSVPNLPAWEKSAAHYVEKFCPGNVNYFNTVLGLSTDQAGPRPPCSSDTFLDVVRSSYSSSYIYSFADVGQPTCVGGYAEEDFVPYADGQQAPFFFNEVSPGKWNLIEGGNTGEFPAACSTIPPSIMAKLGFGCPTPQTQSCSILGGAEGGANLPFTTTGLSCADGTRLVRAVTAAIPNYGTAGTLYQVHGFACRLAPPAGHPPGSQVSPGWRVTCTKGAETLDFELPG